MPKEQFERSSEYRQEASQESKNKFLYLVDVLSERGHLDKRSGIRDEYVGEEGGKTISVRFRSLETEPLKHQEDPWVAVCSVQEMLNKKDEKNTSYVLTEGNEISKHVNIVDIDKEWEKTKEMFGLEEGKDLKMGSGEEETEKAKGILEYAETALKEQERIAKEEKEAGLSFVSEAELKEINNWLERLVGKQKEKRKTT